MGEDAEFWNKYKEAGREKKRNNVRHSLELLRNHGIKFTVLDESVCHYRVGEYSFWPSTGKFYNPRTGEKGRGVFALMLKFKT